jgi:hypothetical protein
MTKRFATDNEQPEVSDAAMVPRRTTTPRGSKVVGGFAAFGALVAACGGASPHPAAPPRAAIPAAPPSEATTDDISRDEFLEVIMRPLATPGQFDTGRTILRADDSMTAIDRPTSCRSRSDHFEQLGSTLRPAGYEREAQRDEGTPSYCAFWIRRIDAAVYARSHAGAGANFRAAREVVDVLRVCVLVKPRDEGCITTYAPAAARLLAVSEDQADLVRLQDRNTDDLRNEVGRFLEQAITGGARP